MHPSDGGQVALHDAPSGRHWGYPINWLSTRPTAIVRVQVEPVATAVQFDDVNNMIGGYI